MRTITSRISVAVDHGGRLMTLSFSQDRGWLSRIFGGWLVIGVAAELLLKPPLYTDSHAIGLHAIGLPRRLPCSAVNTGAEHRAMNLHKGCPTTAASVRPGAPFSWANDNHSQSTESMRSSELHRY